MPIKKHLEAVAQLEASLFDMYQLSGELDEQLEGCYAKLTAVIAQQVKLAEAIERKDEELEKLKLKAVEETLSPYEISPSLLSSTENDRIILLLKDNQGTKLADVLQEKARGISFGELG